MVSADWCEHAPNAPYRIINFSPILVVFWEEDDGAEATLESTSSTVYVVIFVGRSIVLRICARIGYNMDRKSKLSTTHASLISLGGIPVLSLSIGRVYVVVTLLDTMGQ